MSKEELALAMTEIAVKNRLILISSELPFDADGLSQKYLDETATELAAFYHAALKAISEK